jgi:DNA-binding beta-propeller fold protein YncE
LRKLLVVRGEISMAVYIIHAGRSSRLVAVVDTAQREKIVTIAVGGDPIQVFAMPDGHDVYIANPGTATNPDNPVSVIDTAETERL